LELKKRFDRVFFKRSEKGKQTENADLVGEIDFYIEAKDTHPWNKNFNIQACYQLTQTNFEREVGPLKEVEGEKFLVYFEKEENLPNIPKGVRLVDFFSFVQEYCSQVF
jgi:hypothetical protein